FTVSFCLYVWTVHSSRSTSLRQFLPFAQQLDSRTESPARCGMTIHLDYDLLAFIATTLVVIFGSKKQLRTNVKKIPVRYEFEEIPEAALTQAQKEYLRPIDTQLSALNYRSACTFRVKNYGTNLLRRYLNPVDTASGGLTVVETKTNVKGTQVSRNTSV